MGLRLKTRTRTRKERATGRDVVRDARAEPKNRHKLIDKETDGQTQTGKRTAKQTARQTDGHREKQSTFSMPPLPNWACAGTDEVQDQTHLVTPAPLNQSSLLMMWVRWLQGSFLATGGVRLLWVLMAWWFVRSMGLRWSWVWRRISERENWWHVFWKPNQNGKTATSFSTY